MKSCFVGMKIIFLGLFVLSGYSQKSDAASSALLSKTSSVSEKAVRSASANGTTVPSASSITDAQNNVWTLSSAATVLVNGAPAGFTANVVSILYYNGVVYCVNKTAAWYSWKGSGWNYVGTDPRVTATATSKPLFYGINGHPDYTLDAQGWVTNSRAIGAKYIRLDTWGYSTVQVPHIANLARGIIALDPSIRIFAAITAGFDTKIGEDANYKAAYNGARYVAQTLGPAGVTDFEAGNELFTVSSVWPDPYRSGMARSDFAGSGVNGPWACLRGTLRGLIDGVKSVNPSYRVGVNFTVFQIAASDMEWNGIEPDGSTGHPKVRWDITTWHNYSPYGNLFHGGAQRFNLIEYISKAYGKPIMITEFNSGNTCDAAANNYVQTNLQEFYANRNIYNIESFMFYQLGGGVEAYGLLACNLKATTYINFTKANPNP